MYISKFTIIKIIVVGRKYRSVNLAHFKNVLLIKSF